MPVVTPLRPDDPRRVGRYRLTARIADQVADPGSAGRSCPGCPTARRWQSCCSARRPPRTRPPGTGSPPRPGPPAGSRRSAPHGSWMPGSTRISPILVSEFIEGPVARRGGRRRGAAGRPSAQRAGHRRRHRAGRHPPGRAGARGLRPGRPHPGRGRAPGGPVQHHPAVRHRDPRRGPVTPGPRPSCWPRPAPPRCPTRRGLPEPLRNAVSACLAEQASRPQARALLTALLGQSDPAAGLLAEGTRRARAAGRGVVGPSQPAGRRTADPLRHPPGRVHRRPAWPA